MRGTRPVQETAGVGLGENVPTPSPPTERELAELHRQMRLIREFVVEGGDTSHRCAYCGTSCYGRACRQHRDLVQIESRMVAA